MAKTKLEIRKRRKVSIRKKLKGTAERPRLTIFRSNRHIYAQVINDDENSVLVTAGTVGKANQEYVGDSNKSDQAKKVGSIEI